MRRKFGWLWLTTAALTALAAPGCGRTSRDCQLCADTPGTAGTSSGGSSTGGTPASGGASAGQGTAGTTTVAGAPPVRCDYGAPLTPLVAYSRLDLEHTMNDVVGPGPSFPSTLDSRADLGAVRQPSAEFMLDLWRLASARVDTASLQGAPLVACQGTADRPPCIEDWIRDQGLRLYRRPLTDNQVVGFAVAFEEQPPGTTPEAAARNVLLSMLISPYFVYRIELGAQTTKALTIAPPSGPGVMLPIPGNPLSAYEVAARLSHFVWRSGPDAALLAQAASGELLREAGMLAAFDRLMSDARAVPARVQQHLEWLHLEQWGARDAAGDVERLEREQTSRFIADVLTSRDGSLTELLTSSRQPLNAALAQELGISAPLGDAFEMVELDPAFYAGVLGQPAWLKSNPRPSLRGVRILSQLLCTEVPSPPANEPPLGPGNTPRERITSSVASRGAPCQVCHSLFDPTGFALEAFDEQAHLTGFDTSGSLKLQSSGETRPLAGPHDLGQALATSDDARSCAVARAIEYLLQSPLRDDPSGLIDCIANGLGRGEVNLNELARQIAFSPAMLKTMREPSSAVGYSKASDPIQHALDETRGLIQGLPPEDAQALQSYQSALMQLLADKP